MHVELVDLIFTASATGLLMLGGGAALLALARQERDLAASGRAMGDLAERVVGLVEPRGESAAPVAGRGAPAR
jgi:hypothetical protein